jgi:predicted RecA/RadA family phage recombinase
MATAVIQDSIQNVRTLQFAHSAGVSDGDVIVKNNLVVVAINTALANISNAWVYFGKALMPKEASLVVAVGDIVYWDENGLVSGCITKTSTANIMCGFCVQSALSSDTTVLVQLFPDLTNVGTAEIAPGAVGPTEMAAGVLKVAKVTLTNGQIKALRGTQKTLVAAPGATKSIEFVGAALFLNYGSEVLTESADNLSIRYTNGTGVKVSVDIEATNFIDAAADTFTNAIPVKDAIVAAAGALDQPLVLDNDGDGEYAGNVSADTTMTIWIAYRILDWS